MEFINLKAQYRAYKAEIDEAIKGVLHSSQFVKGEEIKTLEANLSTYTNAPYALACSSGTDALLLALMALDVGADDEVITSPFSFIASVEVIMLLGAKPVFVDIDERTYNLDPKKLEAAITPRTKAIIPVAMFGQMADMEGINAIAKAYNLPVIEDAAQSFGACYESSESIWYKSCNASLLATTSFFPSKPLGCYGDGGAVFTSDEGLACKIGYLLNHGQVRRYEHSLIGLNARLDTLQAAVLNVKLKHLDSELTMRQEIATRYNQNLSDKFITPFVAKGHTSAWAQYSIRTKNRTKLIEKLNKAQILHAVHYPIPLHLQEVVCKRYPFKRGDFPTSEMVCEEIISLPFSAFLTLEEQDYIIEVLNG